MFTPRATLLIIYSVFLTSALFSQERPLISITDADLAANRQYRWTADNVYLLDGLVFLEAGAVLTIEAGTVVKAKEQPANGDAVSALIVSRGARIEAVGSPTKPIVFTPERDVLSDSADLRQTDRGLWGGLIILGDAPVNADQPTPTLSGLPAGQTRSTFGGNDATDDSGVLRYVSIRHAGAAGFAGLTLGGVGNKTTLRHIEIFSAAADGFRLWGGTAELKYAAVAFCGEDQFDWDLGYRGSGSYWFSIQSEDAGDQAIEGRGGFEKTPERLSNPSIFYGTFIGPGSTSNLSMSSAIFLHDATGGQLTNSVVTSFPNFALEIEDLEEGLDVLAQMNTCQLLINDNIWWDFGIGEDLFSISTTSPTYTSDPSSISSFLASYGNSYNDPLINTISRNLSDGIELNPTINEFCPTSVGAFSTYWWLDRWPTLEEYGFLARCSGPYFFNQELPLDTQDTILITDYNQLISLKRLGNMALIDDTGLQKIDIGIRFCPGCDETFTFPSVSKSIRRDRTRKRSTQGIEKLLNFNAYCWLEEWSWTEYLYEFTQEAYSLAPVDSIVTTKYFQIVDNEAPQITLLPNDLLAPLPFEVFVDDNDTAWVSFNSDTLIGTNIVEHKWVATDFCGNSSSYTIVEDLSINANQTWYLDRDDDGYGDISTRFSWPNRPNETDKFVNLAGDCNDLRVDLIGNCDNIAIPDLCSQAKTLNIGQYSDVFYGGEPTPTLGMPYVCTGNDNEADLWFKAAAPAGGRIIIKIVNYYHEDFDFNDFESEPIVDLTNIIELYRGTCDNPELISWTCNGNFYVEDLLPGEEVLLRILTYEYSAFQVLVDVPAPSLNDLCANAIELTADITCLPDRLPTNYTTFSGYPDTPSEYDLYYQGDIWFKAATPSSGSMELLSNASVLELYSGTCQELAFLQSGSDRIRIYRQPGEIIYIRVLQKRDLDDYLEICLIEVLSNLSENNICEILLEKGAEGCYAFDFYSSTEQCIGGDQSCMTSFDYSFRVIENCPEYNMDEVNIYISLDEQSNGTADRTLLSQKGISIPTWPEVNLSMSLPIGNHKLWVHLEYPNPNPQYQRPKIFQSKEINIVINDCAPPSFQCNSGLLLPLLPELPGSTADRNNDGRPDRASMVVFAQDFIEGQKAEDCAEQIEYAIYRKSDLETQNIFLSDGTFRSDWSPDSDLADVLWLTCPDTGSVIKVLVFAIDSANNWSWCESQIEVHDNLYQACTETPSASISGIIQAEDGEPVEGVSVFLSGDASAQTTTGADGRYVFEELEAGRSYTVAPFKNDDPKNGASTFDIYLTTQHILRARPFETPLQMLAADVNDSESVSTLDVIRLRRLLLGLTETFANNTSWRFVDKEHLFADPQNPWESAFPEAIAISALPEEGLTKADFWATKVGDVNNSARKNSRQAMERSLQGVFALSVADVWLETGRLVKLHFQSNQIQEILGYQGTLGFDPLALSFLSVDFGQVQEPHFGWKYLSEGLVAMSWNQSSQKTENVAEEPLFSLQFRAKTSGRLRDFLYIGNRITQAEAYSADGALMDVQLVFEREKPNRPVLYPNRPNPFRSATQIVFYLPEASEADLQITDLRGRPVFRLKRAFSAGEHTVEIGLEQAFQPGVYFCTLRTAGFTATRRIVAVE